MAALTEKGLKVSAANVRLLLKRGWQPLARDWGDPLHDIVDVSVLAEGPVKIEYTERWARRHNGKRFVRLDSGALDKVLRRAK